MAFQLLLRKYQNVSVSLQKKKKALKWNQKFYEIISIILNSKPILLLKL